MSATDILSFTPAEQFWPGLADARMGGTTADSFSDSVYAANHAKVSFRCAAREHGDYVAPKTSPNGPRRQIVPDRMPLSQLPSPVGREDSHGHTSPLPSKLRFRFLSIEKPD